MLVTVEGIAFTPHAVETMVKNLRERNQELYQTNQFLAATIIRQRIMLDARKVNVQ